MKVRWKRLRHILSLLLVFHIFFFEACFWILLDTRKRHAFCLPKSFQFNNCAAAILVLCPVISRTAVSCFHGLSVRFERERSFPFLGTYLFSVCFEAIDRFLRGSFGGLVKRLRPTSPLEVRVCMLKVLHVSYALFQVGN